MEPNPVLMGCMLALTMVAIYGCYESAELRQERDQLKQLLNQKQPPVNCPSIEWFNGRRGEA